MKDFLMAALPWVLFGVDIALYTAINYFANELKEAGKLQEVTVGKIKSSMTKNMCVGMGLGMVVGMNGGFGILTGIGGGILVGIFLGAFLGYCGRE